MSEDQLPRLWGAVGVCLVGLAGVFSTVYLVQSARDEEKGKFRYMVAWGFVGALIVIAVWILSMFFKNLTGERNLESYKKMQEIAKSKT